MSMKVLLLSAYDAASHRRWRGGLQVQFPDYQWTQLQLPARYFNWRIRGNSLSWAFDERDVLSRHYDLVIATSMVDLSALRGFVPSLGKVPTLVYFHENQFAYPASDRQHNSVEPQLVNLYTALCADRIAFNSRYNRDSFFDGVAALLRRLPDHVPKGLVTRMQARALCLPVPLESDCFATGGGEAVASVVPADDDCFHLVWNHRWEYDKGPDRFYASLQQLFPCEQAIKCHVVGQQFRQSPAEFEAIKQLLQNNGALGEWGYMASHSAYRQLLSQSQAVVSSALHDFQGLSVMEAVAAGCQPIVPAREAYPEWFGESACYASNLKRPEREARTLAEAIACAASDWREGKTVNAAPLNSVRAMAWTRLRPRYKALFEELAAL